MELRKKGVLITWTLHDIRTTAEHLSDKGFDRYLPSNGAKTALIKALKAYKKTSSDKIYRRWEDVRESVKFTVFAEEVQDNSLQMNGEATIELDKRTGRISLVSGSQSAFEQIESLYASEGPTLNTDQFRAIIQNVVSHDLHGFAARRGGGVYFVDDRFREGLANLKKLFSMFPLNSQLHIMPVYNDEETLDSLEHHASEQLFGQVETLIKEINDEFKKGTINERKLENRKEKAQELIESINIQQENLRSSYESLRNRSEEIAKALDGVTSKVKTGIQDSQDFMSMLEAL
jgi:hypothetical protein